MRGVSVTTENQEEQHPRISAQRKPSEPGCRLRSNQAPPAADSSKTMRLAKCVHTPRWEFLSWLCHMGLPSSHSDGTLQGSGSPSQCPRYSFAKWADNASIAGLLRAKGAHGQLRASQEVRTPGRARPYWGVLPLTQLLLPWKPCVVHPQQLETPGADKEKQVLGQMPHLQYLISTREELSVSSTRM